MSSSPFSQISSCPAHSRGGRCGVSSSHTHTTMLMFILWRNTWISGKLVPQLERHEPERDPHLRARRAGWQLQRGGTAAGHAEVDGEPEGVRVGGADGRTAAAAHGG